jgi:hypothetical protein
LHATIVPPFDCAAESTAVMNAIRPIAATTNPFTVVGHQRQLFGHQREVVVTTLLPVDHIHALHNILSDALEQLKALPIEPAYHRDGFKAHITDNAYSTFAPGERTQIHTLTLVDMRTHQPGTHPEAQASVPLTSSEPSV